VLHSYSQVLFSDSTLLGVFLLGLTFVYPLQGVAGLVGCMVAIVSVVALGISPSKIDSGYYGLNGMLVGLGLGLFFQFNMALIVVLVLAAVLTSVVAVVMKNLLGALMGMQAMSLPFVAVTLLLFMAARGFDNLSITVGPIHVARWLDVLSLPEVIEVFFRSLGAILFQVSSVVGMGVFLGLVLFSRISALLAVVGFASGTAVYLVVGGSMAEIGTNFIGFNFILVSMAIGGVFLVPSLSSYVLAAIASAIAALLAAGTNQVLASFSVPVLALPFNLTVIFFVYALKFNTRHPSVQLVSLLVWRPEDNLRHHRALSMRAPHPLHVRLEPPFLGERMVSQSTDGNETHKDRWSDAWDFVIEQDGTQTALESPREPADFYVFGTPVLAPADGTVVRAIDHYEDNEIGSIDREHNWGNCVVLWHHGFVYSGVYHLKKDSLKVSVGDQVKRGEVIGLCGNSGRSAIPHLHLQAQSGPEPGSPTIRALVAGYITDENGKKTYKAVGNPAKGEMISRPEPSDEVRDAFQMPIGRSLVFKVEGHGDKVLEWNIDVDFLGNLFLRDKQSGQKLYFDKGKREVVFGKLQGPGEGMLQSLLLAAPRIPLCRLDGLQWQDRLAPELFEGKLGRLASDLLRPFGELHHMVSKTQYLGSETVVLDSVTINTHVLKTVVTKRAFGDVSEHVVAGGKLWFDRMLGPVKIEVEHENGKSYRLQQLISNK